MTRRAATITQADVRANGALNLFHIAAAFVVQYATGVVLQYWTPPSQLFRKIFGENPKTDHRSRTDCRHNGSLQI
jgi:hypothetical protein